MHTIVETNAYLAAAKAAGMTDEERADAADTIAADPMAGDLIPGTGGIRKVRIAGRGKGKSGGYRVFHYFGGDRLPIFLVAVISKGDRANLSKADRNAMAAATAYMARTYGDKE